MKKLYAFRKDYLKSTFLRSWSQLAIMNQTNQIINSCSKIQNTQFPAEIDGVKYESLTNYVHLISRQAFLPFSAHETSKDRASVTYECTFSLKGCPAKLIK